MEPARSDIELSGRRVAVTGAGGFIGAAVTRRLAAEGAEVVGLELDPAASERVAGAGAELRVSDVADAAQVDAALKGAELVVHTAAIVGDRGAMADHVRVNVGGTRNVLDAAERHGSERVLHLSSVVVYGYDCPAELDESAFRRTYGIPYIDTKSASDRIAARRGAVVVRPGDVYGPGSVPWTIRAVEVVASGQAALPGRGDGRMLPVYVDDLVDAIVLGLQRGQPGRAYTVWDGSQTTFEDFFNRYAEMTGSRRVRHLPRPVMTAIGAAFELAARATGSPPSLTRNAITLVDRRGTVSNRRAREELGWEPHVDLDEGMRRTEEWLRTEGLI